MYLPQRAVAIILRRKADSLEDGSSFDLSSMLTRALRHPLVIRVIDTVTDYNKEQQAPTADLAPNKQTKFLGRTRFVALRVVPTLVTAGVVVTAYIRREQIASAASEQFRKVRESLPTADERRRHNQEPERDNERIRETAGVG